MNKQKNKNRVIRDLETRSTKKCSSGIRLKLIVAFFIPVILIIILGAVSYLKAMDAITKNYESSALKTVESTADYLNLGFSGVENETLKLVTDSNFIDYYNQKYKTAKEEDEAYKALYKVFVKIVSANEFVKSLSVISSYGKNYASEGTLGNKMYEEFIGTEKGLYLQTLTGTGEWSGYHEFIDEKLGVKENTYSLAYTRPFIQGNGFIFIDIKTDKIKETLKKISFGNESNAYFITGDGKEVILGNTDRKVSDLDLYKTAVENTETSGYKYVTLDGEKQLFVYGKIGNTNSIIGSFIPNHMILQETVAIRDITIVVVIIACIIAILVGSFIATQISNSIRTMQKALSKASEGNLNIEINMKRKDEFYMLSESIMHMLRNMKESIKTTATVGNEVGESTTTVEGISKQLLDASRDINVAISEIEKGASQQADEATTCLHQMQNLTEKLGLVQENTEKIGVFSVRTKDIIKQGLSTVDDLERKSIETKNITEEVIHSIEELALASKSIEGIVGLMNDIAAQTNLLSLNASIEAARAGSAGKGFAVVADEIRQLAEQSAQSANRIGTIVANIQQQTQNIVITTNTVKEILISQGDSLQNTIKVFGNMNQNMEQLTENLEVIGTGVKGVELSKLDTLHAIENISAVAEQTAAASEQVSQIADSQLTVAESLNQSAHILGKNAEQLENAIGMFKIN